MKKVSIIVSATMGLAACTAYETPPDRSDVVLIRARIDSIESAKGSEVDASSSDMINFGQDEVASVSVIDVLIGRVERRSFSANLRMSAMPKSERLMEIFILAKVIGDGRLDVVGWDYAVHGLCIGEKVVRDLKIEREVSNLYDSGSLKCPEP